MIDLGDLAKDTITGYQGIVIGKTEWLHGCTRLILQAQTLHEGKPIDAITVDEPQCEVITSAAYTGSHDTGGPHGADPKAWR